MARMPDEFIDLTVTSPPYDNLRDYKGYSFDFEQTARDLFRVTKKGRVVVWVVNDATIKGSETGTSFRQALYFKEIGFNLHDTMIYQKKNYPPQNHNRYEPCFEFMFVFSKGKLKVFNPIKIPSAMLKGGSLYIQKDGSRKKASNEGGVNTTKMKSNIWRYTVGSNRSGHPAVFPERLANDHIISWSNENDLIYDPFMGSGTTAKMALLNNRRFIGSEISKEYSETANRRIRAISWLQLQQFRQRDDNRRKR